MQLLTLCLWTNHCEIILHLSFHGTPSLTFLFANNLFLFLPLAILNSIGGELLNTLLLIFFFLPFLSFPHFSFSFPAASVCVESGSSVFFGGGEGWGEFEFKGTRLDGFDEVSKVE